MMLTTDTDLARIEAGVFVEAQHAGQRLTRGTVSISGTTLTATGVDVAFDVAGIGPGHVVVVDGQVYEVVERTGAATLEVSRVRARSDAPVQPPTPVTNKAMHIVTFALQREIAYGQVMRSIGIEPEIGAEGEPGVGSILNPGALALLETLAALQFVWMSASLNAGADAEIAMRAERYRVLYGQERGRVGAFIDLDGDGFPDAIRRPGVMQLMRG